MRFDHRIVIRYRNGSKKYQEMLRECFDHDGWITMTKNGLLMLRMIQSQIINLFNLIQFTSSALASVTCTCLNPGLVLVERDHAKEVIETDDVEIDLRGLHV